MMASMVRLPVCFVAREKFIHTAALIASDGHQGTSQSMNERGGVTTGDAPGWDGETNNIVADHDRGHESQTNEPTIPQREWAGDVRGEHQLDMPHGTSWKSRAGSERLRSLAALMQRFALNTDAGRFHAHAGMAERLPHSSYRLLFIAPPSSR